MQQLLPTTTPGSCHEDDNLFTFTSGPRKAQVILVGEAWGSEEAAARKPFVGASGKELDRILADAGLQRESILCCNVVNSHPPANDFTHFLHPNTEKKVDELHGLKARTALTAGVLALYRLIGKVQPKLIIAAGNIPLWALSDKAGISTKAGYKLPSGIASWRGSQIFSREIGVEGRRYPLLPIIHPSAVLREWGFRAITVQDLRRAERFISSPFTNGGRSTWQPSAKTFQIHKPSWQQILHRLSQIQAQLAVEPTWLSVDLETYKRKFISVIGLADSKVEICIPLFSVTGGKVENYLTEAQEVTLWQELKLILEHPNVRIIGQNFIYDTEWFHRYYNIRALVTFDTMVAHHLLFPGTPKRLDYLASLYCDHYIYWKDESQDWDGDIGEQKWKYNCKDTRYTYEIAMALKGAIAQQGMEGLYSFQMEQWVLSRQMMLNGTSFDTVLQKEMRLQLLEEANILSEWLLTVVPASWRYTSTGKPWYDSPKGTAAILYTVLGLTPILHKKTKKPTTDDAALQELSERNGAQWLKPLFDRLRHLRSLGVFTSNFLEAKCGPDGRMRSSFNIAHPETFRWSSNKNGFGEGLNTQNIPKGDKEDEIPNETEELNGTPGLLEPEAD